jgi:hypothetical protein
MRFGPLLSTQRAGPVGPEHLGAVSNARSALDPVLDDRFRSGGDLVERGLERVGKVDRLSEMERSSPSLDGGQLARADSGRSPDVVRAEMSLSAELSQRGANGLSQNNLGRR